MKRLDHHHHHRPACPLAAGHTRLSPATLKIPNLNRHLTTSMTMKSNSPFRLLAAAVLLMAFALAGPVSAATLTWTNTSGGNWASTTNWSPNAIPEAGDTAVISDAETYSIFVQGNRSVDSLVLDNPNATLRLVGSPSTGEFNCRSRDERSSTGASRLLPSFNCQLTEPHPLSPAA